MYFTTSMSEYLSHHFPPEGPESKFVFGNPDTYWYEIEGHIFGIQGKKMVSWYRANANALAFTIHRNHNRKLVATKSDESYNMLQHFTPTTLRQLNDLLGRHGDHHISYDKVYQRYLDLIPNHHERSHSEEFVNCDVFHFTPKYINHWLNKMYEEEKNIMQVGEGSIVILRTEKGVIFLALEFGEVVIAEYTAQACHDHFYLCPIKTRPNIKYDKDLPSIKCKKFDDVNCRRLFFDTLFYNGPPLWTWGGYAISKNDIVPGSIPTVVVSKSQAGGEILRITLE